MPREPLAVIDKLCPWPAVATLLLKKDKEENKLVIAAETTETEAPESTKNVGHIGDETCMRQQGVVKLSAAFETDIGSMTDTDGADSQSLSELPSSLPQFDSFFFFKSLTHFLTSSFRGHL